MGFTYEQIKQIEPHVPFFCFDTDKFRDNIVRMKCALSSETSLFFSLKANPWLAEMAFKCADGAEVCSCGEIDICFRAGADMSKVSFGGIEKELTDIEYALSKGIRRFSVESPMQLEMLERASESAEVKPHLLLRLSNDNQFGMAVKDAADIFASSAAFSHVILAGVHFYPGTQRLTVGELRRDFKKFTSYLSQLQKFSFGEIGYGAGIGVEYFGRDTSDTQKDMIGFAAECMRSLARNYHVTYEAGRVLCADTGVYVTKVIEIKQIGEKTYCIVNGGKNHLIYYGAMFAGGRKPPLSVANANEDLPEQVVSVCGALCNIDNIMAKEVHMRCAASDYLLFELAGAYAVTESSALFLSRALPAIYVKSGGDVLLRRPLIQTSQFNGA